MSLAPRHSWSGLFKQRGQQAVESVRGFKHIAPRVETVGARLADEPTEYGEVSISNGGVRRQEKRPLIDECFEYGLDGDGLYGAFLCVGDFRQNDETRHTGRDGLARIDAVYVDLELRRIAQRRRPFRIVQFGKVGGHVRVYTEIGPVRIGPDLVIP